jgi:pimeloyl-ACP methyl ester carboxylesterase
LVEEISLRSIEQARLAYVQGGLRDKLARHHADPDSAFWGWNQIWLDPAFAQWSIEDEVSRITVPVLAIQGLNDEYGTLEQIRGIARRAPQTELLELPDCGHSPHRDQPQALITAITQFFGRHSQRA